MKLPGYKTKILLVGNLSYELKLVLSTLEKNGFSVFTTINGGDAFRFIRREQPDLVLSQVNLPKISGLDLCRMIREDRDLFVTPFVFISNPEEVNENVMPALSVGADDYLSVFTNPQLLVAKLTRIIEKKNAEEASRQYYRILSYRQQFISQIIKSATDYIDDLDKEVKNMACETYSEEVFQSGFSKKVEVGLNMVDALAHLLEEQEGVLRVLGKTLSTDTVYKVGKLPEHPVTKEVTEEMTFSFVNENVGYSNQFVQ